MWRIRQGAENVAERLDTVLLQTDIAERARTQYDIAGVRARAKPHGTAHTSRPTSSTHLPRVHSKVSRVHGVATALRSFAATVVELSGRRRSTGARAHAQHSTALSRDLYRLLLSYYKRTACTKYTSFTATTTTRCNVDRSLGRHQGLAAMPAWLAGWLSARQRYTQTDGPTGAAFLPTAASLC